MTAAGAGLAATQPMESQSAPANPFFAKWNTPHELPPFAQIRAEHFLPAMREGMKLELTEMEAIAANPAPPTFANTVEAMERSGEMLARVNRVFRHLIGCEADDALQVVEREAAPLQARHTNAIYLNGTLFARIDEVFKKRATLGLDTEQTRLLERYHSRFVRRGAALDPAGKKRMDEIDGKLAQLTTRFNQNLLADTKDFVLVIDKESDLDGLPQSFRAAAAQAAADRKLPGKWVVTLQRPSVEPFLQLSKRRDLREKAFKAWALRGDNDNQFDNKAVIREIVLLRIEKARMLGFKTFADYVLDDAMAKTPAAARGLLTKVWSPATDAAKREAAELSAALKADGVTGPLEPWDWRYYSEKVRLAKYQLDEEQIKPYFPLDRMIEASFHVANQLFGLTFKERTDLPKYNPDIRTYEVYGPQGRLLGIFYGDYYARPTKRSGAWMNSLREQQKLAANVTPVVTNNLNFSKPPAGETCLLSYDDAETLFHEFGHGLHGLLSNVRYPALSGTGVSRDFVELPSQILEHWLLQKPVLEKFARHYKTNEPIPPALLEKIQRAAKFDQGFATVEYLASALVDLEWHSLEKPQVIDVREMENEWLKKLGMPREIIMRHRSTHFAHIFAGGYAAGYYSYMWSEVLDADGFEAFKEAGNPFDPAVARRLYEIYSSGGSKDPAELYKNFRGRQPGTDALMRNRGFAPEK